MFQVLCSWSTFVPKKKDDVLLLHSKLWHGYNRGVLSSDALAKVIIIIIIIILYIHT